MTVSWLGYVEALGAVTEGKEVALMYMAPFGLTRWRRNSLSSFL